MAHAVPQGLAQALVAPPRPAHMGASPTVAKECAAVATLGLTEAEREAIERFEAARSSIRR